MPHLVFLDSSVYGVKAIQKARSAGHEVTFVWAKTVGNLAIAGNPPALLQTIRACVDRFIEAEDFDSPAVLAQLELAHATKRIDAIITTSDPAVVPAARLAAHFGCQGPGVEALENAVFKDKCRQILRDASIRSTPFVVRSLADLAQVPDTLPFPVVVKPVRGFAKQFTAICQSPAELAVFARRIQAERENARFSIRASISPTYLIEARLSGQLISAEVIWMAGKLYPMTVTKRLRSIANELVELAAVMPSELPYSDDVLGYVEVVLNALGLQSGLLHIELIQTGEGPVLVEINARMMGSISPGMYEYVFGVDPFDLLIDLSLGKAPSPQIAVPGRAAITLAVGASGGGKTHPEVADALPSYLERFPILLSNLKIPADQEIMAQKDNITAFGQVILTGTSSSQVESLGLQFLDGLEKVVGLDLHRY